MSAILAFHSHSLLVRAAVIGLGVAVTAGSAGPDHRRTAATDAQRPFRSERVVDSLLARMTWAEKLGQLNLVSASRDRVTPEQEDSVRKGLIGGFLAQGLAPCAAASLAVTAQSSNPALVPNANLVLGGAGSKDRFPRQEQSRSNRHEHPGPRGCLTIDRNRSR